MSSPVVVAAKAKHTATVLWFHGLGDSGSGWYFLAQQLGNVFPHVKWVLPNAPVKTISMNGGVRIPAWFDVSGADKFSLKDEDEEGMLGSVASVTKLIQDEVDNGIPSERILVGGFSQGCVLSLLTGLTCKFKLAGVIGCSGWLGLSERFPGLGSEANKNTPILLCHGDSDNVVNPRLGKVSAEKLESFGYNITRKTYPGLAHSANEQELRDIAEFIQKVIPNN